MAGSTMSGSWARTRGRTILLAHWAPCLVLVLGALSCRPTPDRPGPTPADPPPSPPPEPPPGAGPSGGPSGACDARYDSAGYAASSRRSDGVNPGHSTGERPTFVASSSRASGPVTFAVAGAELGGVESRRGLLLDFDEAGALRFGYSLSHCEADEVESVALFEDGSLAASTTYLHEGSLRTDLIKVSPAGEIEWRHLLATDPCSASACFSQVHSEVEVDHHDESVVAAIQGTGDELVMVRVGSDGRELRRRVLTTADTGVAGQALASLAIYEGLRTTQHSQVLLGLSREALLLSPTFDKMWVQTTGGGAHVEVAMCEAERFTMVNVGAEYFSTDHVVSAYSKAGAKLFDLRVAGAPGSPALGVTRGDTFNLGCHEQDVPELVLRKSDGGSESHSEVVGLMLLHTGVVHRVYDARLPTGSRLSGFAGVGLSADALLVRQDGKFRMVPPTSVGWRRR